MKIIFAGKDIRSYGSYIDIRYILETGGSCDCRKDFEICTDASENYRLINRVIFLYKELLSEGDTLPKEDLLDELKSLGAYE